jgi:hypothetical protein
VESKRVYSSESSGYETSPVISSDNNMDIHPSLEDDDSINDAIIRIKYMIAQDIVNVLILFSVCYCFQIKAMKRFHDL